MKAWLIRWRWSGDHAAVDYPILTVLSARSEKRVRQYIQQRYIEEKSSFNEKLSYAHYNDPEKSPPVRLDQGKVERVIHCGDNPWLEAILVKDLHVETNESSKEVLRWKKLSQ